MTNTPPPRNPDDATDDSTGRRAATDAGAVDAETPVFDDGVTEHPEVQDAAPDLIEPEPTAAGPASQPDRATPPVEPVERRTEHVEVVQVQDTATDTAEAAGYSEHIDEPAPAEAEPLPAAAPVSAARPAQTVYVAAPVRPRKKGNRGFGLLFAFLGTIVFAIVFAAVIALIMLVVRPQNAFGGSVLGFIENSAFWVPVAVFLVVFALFALIVNRGTWAAWVLSSFLVAVIVYFASIGIILLLEGVLGMTAVEAGEDFSQLALSAPLVVAGILAREVTIWFGAAIAARGRKVKERNLEARAAYERELDNQPLGFS